jgi:Spy/CpxP family protein refolding chaperone
MRKRVTTVLAALVLSLAVVLTVTAPSSAYNGDRPTAARHHMRGGRLDLRTHP